MENPITSITITVERKGVGARFDTIPGVEIGKKVIKSATKFIKDQNALTDSEVKDAIALLNKTDEERATINVAGIEYNVALPVTKEKAKKELSIEDYNNLERGDTLDNGKVVIIDKNVGKKSGIFFTVVDRISDLFIKTPAQLMGMGYTIDPKPAKETVEGIKTTEQTETGYDIVELMVIIRDVQEQTLLQNDKTNRLHDQIHRLNEKVTKQEKEIYELSKRIDLVKEDQECRSGELCEIPEETYFGELQSKTLKRVKKIIRELKTISESIEEVKQDMKKGCGCEKPSIPFYKPFEDYKPFPHPCTTKGTGTPPDQEPPTTNEA